MDARINKRRQAAQGAKNGPVADVRCIIRVYMRSVLPSFAMRGGYVQWQHHVKEIVCVGGGGAEDVKNSKDLFQQVAVGHAKPPTAGGRRAKRAKSSLSTSTSGAGMESHAPSPPSPPTHMNARVPKQP